MSSLSKDKKLSWFEVIVLEKESAKSACKFKRKKGQITLNKVNINITLNHDNFLSFDNDDMKPSKRQVSFISLIFALKRV